MADDNKINTLDFISEWESGDVDINREAEGFQHLIDSGVIFHLQGAYGRRAAQLEQEGLVHGFLSRFKEPVY